MAGKVPAVEIVVDVVGGVVAVAGEEEREGRCEG